MKPIYLDYNATTPIDPEVAETMRPFLYDHFGNPSSSHWYGTEARRAVEAARRQIAELLGCNPDEIIFTSGGSESNNHAIKGAALAGRTGGNRIITSAVEHPAVTEVCSHLERQGFTICTLPVDEHGLVDPGAVAKAITPQTILITIMHANNEVGTIQPISEIAAIARENGIPFHSDAAQSLGKIPVRVEELGVDLLSIAGHKLYAPKGIGALYIRRGMRLEKFIHGADHEQNLRAGTENVMLAAGLGKACEIAGRDIEANMRHMTAMRDRLQRGLERELDGIRLNGHPEARLPNTLSVGFANIEADTLLAELREVAASPGAACHSEAVELSPVLAAMGVPNEFAVGTVRFSTGRGTGEEEIDRAVGLIAAAVKRLQPAAPGEPAATTDQSAIKLTHFTHGLGCACKLRPQALEAVLEKLPLPDDPNVLVGAGTSDDAAIYRLPGGGAIVQTLDFFTPIVDDPADFGAIAAANAFSDIYAMGGSPLFALNIVGFPSNRLPLEVLHRILMGALESAAEAGVSIIGGHTVDDTEPKYGLAVSGLIDADRIITNAAAEAGDMLILTKPLGIGIMATAMKRGLADDAAAARVVAIMRALNRTAAETMLRYGVNACTDITGFGLLGHLREMTIASGVDAEIWLDRLPIIPESWEMAAANAVPGGSLDNMAYVADSVDWSKEISRVAQIILCDAQTSGGLLISAPPDDADRLLAALHEQGIEEAAIIGTMTAKGAGRIAVSGEAPC